jgi:tetratricopeptide (TPR) repeat protein
VSISKGGHALVCKTPDTPAKYSVHPHPFLNPVGRAVIAVVAIVACLAGIWVTACFGFSRLMARYANLSASLPAADEAVRLTPRDPESHRARGAVLRYLGQLSEASKEYEMAVSLRPRDDLLWSELGIVREENGDQQGALEALNESVRAAPFYASPRWQRGNVLLRMQRYDEGFADLRQAAASDQELLPNMIDLAWGLSRSDLKLTEQILEINDDQMRLSFARFLARKGRGPEAVEQLREVRAVPDHIRREMVSHLIMKRSFDQAYAIWANRGSLAPHLSPGVFDGGFEGPLSFEETGFGWRVVRGQTGLSPSVDPFEKQSGSKCLRIQFNGDSNPGTLVLSQLILVKPLKRYRLSFASRTQEIVTGGLPVVVVCDTANERILGKGAPMREGTNEWKAQSFEFTTGSEEEAALVIVRRENCATDPCPIFGLLWLDSFSIEELN